MMIQVTRGELLLLICSLKPDVKTCVEYTNQSLMKFTGNSWTEDWEWNQQELEGQDEANLMNLWHRHKEKEGSFAVK